MIGESCVENDEVISCHELTVVLRAGNKVTWSYYA